MRMDDKERMIESHLKGRGITDEQVLEAFRSVPREEFVPEESRVYAYADHPLPIGRGQTISQPYIVALTVQALEISGTDVVLEIGTGSGYAAAVMAELAACVITLERVQELADQAGKVLERLRCPNITVIVSDGTLGYAAEAPYDCIAAAAAAPDVPQSLLDQLSPGGRMIIPVGPEGLQELLFIKKDETGKVAEKRNICDCSFVPLIGEEGY